MGSYSAWEGEGEAAVYVVKGQQESLLGRVDSEKKLGIITIRHEGKLGTEDAHQEVLRHPQEGPGGDLQTPDQQVLREVHQRVPLPRGEAELPHRAYEEVRAGVPPPPQEGQEVPVQQGVRARDQAGVREPRGQEIAPRLRQNPEER